MVARNERAACYAPFEPQQFDGASGGDRRFDLVELQRPEASEFSSSGVIAVVPASLRKGGETVGTFAGEQQPDGLGRGLRGGYASGRPTTHLESKRAHRAGQEASRRDSLGGKPATRCDHSDDDAVPSSSMGSDSGPSWGGQSRHRRVSIHPPNRPTRLAFTCKSLRNQSG